MGKTMLEKNITALETQLEKKLDVVFVTNSGGWYGLGVEGYRSCSSVERNNLAHYMRTHYKTDEHGKTFLPEHYHIVIGATYGGSPGRKAKQRMYAIVKEA